MMYGTGRTASLMARKAQIDIELQQEMISRTPDQLRLSTLKRRKLMVKEELDRLGMSY